MPLGQFTLTIGGERQDGTAETKAKLHLRPQGVDTLIDADADLFYFPTQFADGRGVNISLSPTYSIDLYTDTAAGEGESTTIGYEGWVRTDQGRVDFQIAAQEAGATVSLTDLVDTVVVPVSTAQGYVLEAETAATAAEAAQAAAEAAAASVPSEAELSATYASRGEGTSPADSTGAYAYSAGASTPLDIATYDGGGEITHPSVYFNAEGWNGHRYWMAATPYPGSNPAYENPSIYCSDDGATWTPPAGLTNPIEPAPGGGAYLADTHLIVVGGTMFCFFVRQAWPTPGAEQQVVFKTSTDGVTWSATRTALADNQTVRRMVSPAVVHEGGVWHLWAVDIIPSPNTVLHLTATDPEGPWTTEAVCTGLTLPTGREPWHLDVHRDGSELVMVLNDTATGVSGAGGALYRAVSRDGDAWTTDSVPFMTPKKGRWDSNLYRSAFLPATVQGRAGYEVWYSSSLPLWKVGRTTVAVRDTRPVAQDANVNMLAARAALSPYVLGDAVTRADSATSPGVADSGQTWTVTGGTLGVTSRTIYAPSAGNNQMTATTGLANGEFGVTNTVAPGTVQWWLQARKADNSNHIRFGWSGTQYSLEKVVGGSVTSLATGGIPTYVAPGAAGDRLALVCSGTNVKAYVNEMLVAEATVAELTANTGIGIKSDSTTVRLRNIYAKSL